MGKTPSDGMNTTRLLFFLLVSLGLSLVATAQGIQFESGEFEAAQAKAAKQGKMLMLFV